MRILLFQPRGKPWNPASADISHLAAVLPPLGLASMAAVLRKAGHDVAILDATLTPRVPNDTWASRISAWRPDLVGFSAITPAFLDAYDVCRRVKDSAPDVKTVFGGVHVSWGRERILARFPAIDCVVSGEGELAMARLAAGETPGAIPGLVYRENGRVLAARPQEREDLCNLDDLPFPAWDLVAGFPRRYYLPLASYTRHPGTHLVSSRGCVYQCSYCDRSVFQRTFRWNSPQYTFELVKHLRTDYGVRHVFFYDDLFTLNRERVAELCGLLREARLGVRFNCIVRIGHIDQELIALLKGAGCFIVSVGIESGDQAILDANKEGLRLEDVRRDVTALHQAGLYVKGLFMMGFPGEGEASIRTTIDFACSLPLKDANVTAFTPFPGAPITARIRELGEFDDNWDLMDCTHFVFRPRELPSRSTLERLYGEFLRRFYSRPFLRPLYRRMLWESPHSVWRLLCHLGTFLAYRRRLAV
jgi:radical SAM superfamily enzyme YgiQ (UPF0313 family)